MLSKLALLLLRDKIVFQPHFTFVLYTYVVFILEEICETVSLRYEGRGSFLNWRRNTLKTIGVVRSAFYLSNLSVLLMNKTLGQSTRNQ